MREILINFFRDDTFGPKMGLWNLTHILVYLFVMGMTVFMALKFYKKEEKVKQKILNILICIVVGLYFGDFFIHPLMNNENYLIVDKLPFHLCTSASILIFFSRNFKHKLGKFYHAPIVLGLIGSFLYITVPTGVSGDYLFCYRTLQTLIYHSLLFMFGVLCIVYQDIKLNIKTFYYEVIMLAVQIVISLFANAIYATEDHHYDWYFSTGSSFGLNEYLAPFVVLVVLASCALVVYGIYYLVIYLVNKHKNKLYTNE